MVTIHLRKTIGAGEYAAVIQEFEQNGGYSSVVPETGNGWSLLITTCDSYFNVRDYTKLDECLSEFEKFHLPESSWFTVNDNDTKLFIHSRRAEVQVDFGNYAKAYEYAQKAEEFYFEGIGRKSSSGIGAETWYVETLRAMGVAAALSGDSDNAEQVADRLWNHSVQHLAQDLKTRVNRVLRNSVAAIHMARRDYPRVLAAYEDPLPKELVNADRVFNAVMTLGASEIIDRVVEAAFEPWHVDKAFPKNFSLSKTFFELGEIEKARTALDDGLASSVAQNFGTYYSVMLFDRARIAEMDGDEEMAEELLRRSIDIIESKRSTINAEAARIGFVGDKQDTYGKLIALYFRQGRLDEAFEYVERAKARALVDLLATKGSFGGRDRSAETSGLLAEYDRLEQPVTKMMNKATDGSASTLRGVRIMERITVAEPQLASLVSVSAVSVQKLQALLPIKEALVEFYRHDDQFYAFVLKKDGITAAPISANGIDDMVVAVREAVSGKNAGNTSYRSPAQDLYEKLFTPIALQIAGYDLTIIPHGRLHYVPFAALLGPDGFLIDNHALRILPSASVMSFLPKRNEHTLADSKLLVLGNPDLGNPGMDLPGAGREARNLAEIFSGARLFLRKQASETVVKVEEARFNYVHLASHGTFNSDAPLSPAMLLSADNRNDGKLTVSELYDLRLNADLVTLSACETALGKVAAGDDVVGFTRGFLFAGARSIVSSLWQVEDEATALLMVNFYSHLNSEDKRQALRAAQLEVKKEKQHPFYWAAFQLTGAVD